MLYTRRNQGYSKYQVLYTGDFVYVKIKPVQLNFKIEIKVVKAEDTYTGQQKKGYKVICLLFYKTE